MNKRLIYGMSQGGLRGQGSYMSIFTNTTPQGKNGEILRTVRLRLQIVSVKKHRGLSPVINLGLQRSGTYLIEWDTQA